MPLLDIHIFIIGDKEILQRAWCWKIHFTANAWLIQTLNNFDHAIKPLVMFRKQPFKT